jgi:hypothetical protein
MMALTEQQRRWKQVDREKRELAQSRYHLPNFLIDVGGTHQLKTELLEISQQWAEYLDNPSFDWSWYGHYTFRGYPHIESARKAWDVYIHELNRKIFGWYYWKDKSKGVPWARGTEYQNRGAVHFHAIIGGIPECVRRFDSMERWYGMAGICRIYPYERGRGAEFYMSKSSYAWKKGEIDLGGPLRDRLETRQIVLPIGVN